MSDTTRSPSRSRSTIALALLPLLAAGCAARDPEAGLKATQADPAIAQNAYWLAQEPTATAQHDDFQTLWRAARRAATDRGFTPDRVDFRSGVLTTFPLVSKQFFEVWRSDVVTLPALAESSLATIRRTIRWDIRKTGDGTYEATPTVLVERHSVEERRLTSAMQYREIFSIERAEGDERRDRGENAPEEYWYALGRDRKLEAQLAAAVRGMVR